MFYDRFLELCNKKGISPSRAATESGINKASVTYWKKKKEKGLDIDPDQEIIDKFCAYFLCDEAWLRGISETEKTPTLTEKDERDTSNVNIIKIAGRDGSYREKRLSDEQLALFQSMLDQMKPVDDEI